MKLQKMKLIAMNTLQGNESQNATESEPDDLNSNTGKCVQEPKAGDSLIYFGTEERRAEEKGENNMYTSIVSSYY